MIAGCLLTAILIVVPAVPAMDRYFPALWLFNQQELQGACKEFLPPGKMYVEHRRLIILYVGVRYVIPFPPKEGRWPMSYWIGDEFCDMGVWGMVQVRRGPKDPI